jgi:hypothetical protein
MVGLQDQSNVYTIRTLHLSILFSIRQAVGMRTRMMRKYRMDAIWPMMMNGGSTGCPPIYVRERRSAVSAQNKHWLIGRNIRFHCLDVWRRGKAAKIRMDNTRPMTPLSLLRIGCRIVYANKKYHSGLVCGGVFRGLAGV